MRIGRAHQSERVQNPSEDVHDAGYAAGKARAEQNGFLVDFAGRTCAPSQRIAGKRGRSVTYIFHRCNRTRRRVRAAMECTLALVGDGYCLVAADRNAARSIICFKKDEDKVTVLDSHKIMGSSGARAASRRVETPSTRLVSRNDGRGSFLVRF